MVVFVFEKRGFMSCCVGIKMEGGSFNGDRAGPL